MRNCCGNCGWWEADLVDAVTGCAMPEVRVSNCRVHLKDTDRDDSCRCHSRMCSAPEAIERRNLGQEGWR
jgi:hypothetical protein